MIIYRKRGSIRIEVEYLKRNNTFKKFKFFTGNTKSDNKKYIKAVEANKVFLDEREDIETCKKYN